MNDYIRFFNIIGGIGILLFSFRYLNTIIESTVSRRFKPLVNRILSNQFNSFFTSFLGTILIQASSITVIGSMGLLSNSIITLEQGFFIALGASLGSAFKSWFFNVNVFSYSLTIIGISSILLIFFKRLIIKEALQLLLALGFAFLSFNIMSQILPDISQSEYFRNFITGYTTDSLKNQFVGILIGFFVTCLIQSSSAFIFLVITLANDNLLSFETGSLLILGANIGTTITPLIVSLEYEKNVKKLAVAYMIAKTLGVLITLFFFPYFINSIDILSKAYFLLPSNGTKVLGTHTIFNIINCIWWSIFYSFIFRFINIFLPDDSNSIKALPLVIRKMVSSNYKIAIEEIENQINKLETVTKNLTDYCLELMTITEVEINKKNTFQLFRKDFESLKDTVYEIILQLNKNNLGGVKNEYNKINFKFISQCNDFYSHALSFSMHLEQGIFVDYYTFPSSIRDNFEEFENFFNNIWLSVLLNKSTKEDFENINNVINQIEEEYFLLISQKNNYTHEHLTWIYESVSYLKKMVYSLTTIKKSINLVKMKDFEKK